MTESRHLTRRLRAPLVAGLVALALLFTLSPAGTFLGRAGLDFVLPALAPDPADRPDDPALALVVIDEATHATPPFTQTPEVAWTPFLAEALRKVDRAGAAVIGLDLIYPKTLDTPDLVPGFDRPLLQALAAIGRQNRLVLGEVRLSETPIEPYQGQILAVGGRRHVRPVGLTPDRDGVVRAYPAAFRLEDGNEVPSFASELAGRTGRSLPPRDFLIDFLPPTAIPAYRLSDLVACPPDALDDLRHAFAGRIVIFGTSLDVEDRHPAANRFVARKPSAPDRKPCPPSPLPEQAGGHRQTIPGVMIHALAVQTLLSGRAPRLLPAALNAAVILILTLAASLAFLRWSPLAGFGTLAGVFLTLWGSALIALQQGLLLPYLSWGTVLLFCYLVLITYRTIFEDQEKRWIRHAFRHYLSPALVEQLSAHPERLKLGGERRHVAVMFLDLEAFTTLSEHLAETPERLMTLLNRVLGHLAKVIESHDGYVDKYVGDAIMAVWGAPVANRTPERLAAEAALACREALEALNRTAPAEERLGGVRIGIHAGTAIAGNIGSKERFDYTLIGDTVNIAARLEQANKTYGTTILISDAVKRCLGPGFATRFIAAADLAGRVGRVPVHELTGRAHDDENLPPEAPEQAKD